MTESDTLIPALTKRWYLARIKKVTVEQLKDYKFICANSGIEWESIDYHLSIESMLGVSLKTVA